MKRRPNRNDSSILRFIVAGAIFCAGIATVAQIDLQIYLPKNPPPPAEYGRVVLDNHTPNGPGAVVFDHWLHRSKFTCRLCHVDVGFAMEANATGISDRTNHAGFHCGACHNGKTIVDGKPVFAACSDSKNANLAQDCLRCHSAGKQGVRQYEYSKFTARFPKAIYGVDWELAERNGMIKLIDFIDGVSVKKTPLRPREDFPLQTHYSWVHPITFSHEKHTIWNGCELCHPEIFPAAVKDAVHYSMFYNIEGRYCGECHGKVAFPLNNCRKCHEGAPLWAP